MEQVFLGLLGSSPAAVAVIITVHQFLKYLHKEREAAREERADWRAAMITALNNNSLAMQAQTEAMRQQGETMKALVVAIEKHDDMARTAIARIEAK